MKIVEEKFNRYGEKDYDESYINWGFDDLDGQIVVAEKILNLVPNANSILDVACGIGRYHQVWLEKGILVTGIDISETFLQYARDNNKDYANAAYLVCAFDDLDFFELFDLVTFTDAVGLTGKATHNIYRALKPGGVFVYELWNENYYKYHDHVRHKDHQTWTEEGGVYHLIRHKYNKVTSTNEHEEVIFDVPNDTMVIKDNLNSKYVNMYSHIQILEAAGFTHVHFVDYDGNDFNPVNDQVQRFFMIGQKQFYGTSEEK